MQRDTQKNCAIRTFMLAINDRSTTPLTPHALSCSYSFSSRHTSPFTPIPASKIRGSESTRTKDSGKQATRCDPAVTTSLSSGKQAKRRESPMTTSFSASLHATATASFEANSSVHAATVLFGGATLLELEGCRHPPRICIRWKMYAVPQTGDDLTEVGASTSACSGAHNWRVAVGPAA